MSGYNIQQPSKAKDPTVSATIALNDSQTQAIINYATSAQSGCWTQTSMRNYMQQVDQRYMRELDFTQEEILARRANNLGDPTKLQNFTLPIIMPQVETAVTYLANVFLTGYPIFGVSANVSNIAAAQQLEALISDNANKAQWVPELLKFFRDGLKYNIHALECQWVTKTVNSVDPAPNVASKITARAKEVVWQGNVIKRVDLYNAFWDTRVVPNKIAENGEFAGYTEIYSRIRMKQYINDLYDVVSKSTAIKALESGSTYTSLSSSSMPFGYYEPNINPYPKVVPNTLNNSFNWSAWATNTTEGRGIKYGDSYSVTTLYARILPSDFSINVPASNTPQIWKFIIINGKIVLLAERLTNIHNMLPMFFGQPLDDGLRYQTKSFADNVTPMQDLASGLWNAFIASKRRLITDRVLYDPSRIRSQDINSPNPSAKIPVKASAYGRAIGDSVYQFPYRDDQANSLVMAADQINKYANVTNNQNPAMQGQFVPGNKTLQEYQDTMGHGNAGNQMIAMAIEHSVFMGLKDVLLTNYLQYQQDGTAYNFKTNAEVKVDQLTIRRAAVRFTMSDGLIPKDKQMGTETLQTAFQVIGSSPQIGQGYNIPPMFSYLMSLHGANISQFEKSPLQMQYEQAMGAWQQAAQEAADKGAPFNTPQPEPSPELKQLMQQQQQLWQQNSSNTDAIANVVASVNEGAK